MFWSEWWVWVVGGLTLAVLELVIPGYIFLGTAFGAVVVGLVLWSGVPPAEWIASSPANGFLALAVLSLVLWLALRRFLGIRKGQVKVWDRDINED